MRAISALAFLAGLSLLMAGGAGMASADTHADNIQGLMISLAGLVITIIGAAFLGRAMGRAR